MERNKVSDANVTAETLCSLCSQPPSTRFQQCPLITQRPVCINPVTEINLKSRCLNERGLRHDRFVQDLPRVMVSTFSLFPLDPEIRRVQGSIERDNLIRTDSGSSPVWGADTCVPAFDCGSSRSFGRSPGNHLLHHGRFWPYASLKLPF